MLYNIYCDESCHLEHDKQPIMILGCIWCPQETVREIVSHIRKLKEQYHSRGELKWTKVSVSRIDFFLEVVEYFFSNSALNFRCLIVNNKQLLDHDYYNLGSHDSFYYKMYYYLLHNVITEENNYNIYTDLKDTLSQSKINNLRDVLCNSFHDFDRKLIPIIQHVRSKETEVLQLADFLMGAISYYARKLSSNAAKGKVIEKIYELSRFVLDQSSPPWERKFNLFYFSPRRLPHA
jgi:hypothetical protein